MKSNDQRKVRKNGISKTLKHSSDGDLKKPSCELNYINYSDAVKQNIIKIYETNIQTFLTKDQYRDQLQSVFQEELKEVPINLEKYMVLYKVQICLYCDICAKKISYFDRAESCTKVVLQHIKGKPHINNVKMLTFDETRSNFNLDDAILLPYDIVLQFPIIPIEEKKYFKMCLYLFFKCIVCEHKFPKYNKVLPIRRAIYNHINNWKHVSKYIKIFPNLDYSVKCSKDIILSSIDSIYKTTKTFISKELYSDILCKIFQNKLEKIPNDTEKYIMVRVELSLNCKLCVCKIFQCNYKGIEEQVNLHIQGKKHYKQSKLFLPSHHVTSKFNEYSVIDGDRIKVPDKVLTEMFQFLKHNDYEKKVKSFINGNFVFNVRCIVCDEKMVSTDKLSSVQQVIYAHINSKKHVSETLKLILH